MPAVCLLEALLEASDVGFLVPEADPCGGGLFRGGQVGVPKRRPALRGLLLCGVGVVCRVEECAEWVRCSLRSAKGGVEPAASDSEVGGGIGRGGCGGPPRSSGLRCGVGVGCGGQACAARGHGYGPCVVRRVRHVVPTQVVPEGVGEEPEEAGVAGGGGAVRLLRGLVWGQHYRHSNPQCEGGIPRSFELREDMGADGLQAVEDWLRVEGYAYRFRQKRWRVWTRPDRPGEGLRPDGIGKDKNPNEYRLGTTINVSVWDTIEKKFPELGNERTLQGSSSSPSLGKEKRSAGDKKRDKEWREYQRSLAAEAAQAAEIEIKGGTPAPSPQRVSGGHHPGHTTLYNFLEVAKKAKAKPRQLHLRKSGPSSDVESAHRGRVPANQGSSSSSVAPDQRDVTRVCERACGVPCNLRVARQRATQQNAAVEGPSGSPRRRPQIGAEAWPSMPRPWRPSRLVSRLQPHRRQRLPGPGVRWRQLPRKPAWPRRPLSVKRRR